MTSDGGREEDQKSEELAGTPREKLSSGGGRGCSWNISMLPTYFKTQLDIMPLFKTSQFIWNTQSLSLQRQSLLLD